MSVLWKILSLVAPSPKKAHRNLLRAAQGLKHRVGSNWNAVACDAERPEHATRKVAQVHRGVRESYKGIVLNTIFLYTGDTDSHRRIIGAFPCPAHTPRSLSSHSSNFLRNPHRLRLPEIVFWSLIEWFYWMAFMVLIVWAVAQMQVESTLRKEPNLVGRLHNYAQVGRDWETLSVAADIAGPVLQVVTDLRSAPYWSEIDVLIL